MQSALHFPLNEILGSRATLLVMRALMRHGGEMSVTLIVAHTGLSKRSVHHALSTLESLRVVQSLGTSRARLYKERVDHPLREPLAVLFEAEEDRYSAILAAAGQIADADKAILAVWLYGSVARNEDTARSDVDLALVVVEGAAATSEAVYRERLSAVEELYAFNASVIALETADIERLKRDADPWWASLVRDAHAIRGERPDQLLRRITRARTPT
jgi:predicted nucleotidyltransferase